jgi:hypothetical protein
MRGALWHTRPATLRHSGASRQVRTVPNGLTRLAMFGLIVLLVPLSSPAQQPADSSHVDQSLDDAWFTGPMLAASPNTLPRGHILIEPYFFDVRTAHADGFGTLTYALVGITDRLTAGSIITTGLNKPEQGTSSSGMGLDDLTLQATYRLTNFRRAAGFRSPPSCSRKRCPPASTTVSGIGRAMGWEAARTRAPSHSMRSRITGCPITGFFACA